MKKNQGFFSYYGLVFSQVAIATIFVGTMELVFGRMGFTATGSWQFYVLHLLFLLPCVLLLTPAGYFSDKYPKERVLLYTTLLSLPVLGIFCFGVYEKSVPLVLVSVGLFFILQAFQSPARGGYLKELMGVRNLAYGTGILMIVCFSAFVLSGLGLALASLEEAMLPVLIAVGVLQMLGIVFAMRLPAIGAFDREMKFPWKRYWNLVFARRKFLKAWSNRGIRQSIIGLSMFWVLIFLMVFVIQDQFCSGSLFGLDALVNYAILGAAIGLIGGFAFAMRMSNNFIETGLVPMGTAGSAILIYLIPFIPRPYNAIAFALLGFCAGMYMLPMFALLLYNSKPRSAGHVLAVNNMVQNLCVIAFDVLAILSMRLLGLDRMDLFFLLGIFCTAATVWALWIMPQSLLRQLLRTTLSLHYKFIVNGLKNLPWEGPVFLVSNHISYIDWALIQMASPRPLRFVLSRRSYEKWYVRLILSQMNVIDLDLAHPEKAMQEAHESLLRGEAVVVFPENALSPTGNVNRFRLDYSSAIKDVPKLTLLPLYVQGLWGSSYSMASAGYQDIVHSGGRIVSVAFGKPVPVDCGNVQMLRSIQELSITAWEAYIRRLRPVPNSWIRASKRRKNSPLVFSPDGKHFSGYSLATAAITFANVFDKLLGKDEKCVGILIPPSGPGIFTNLAMLIKARTVCNLNYSSTPETMDYCCKVAGVKTIVTAHAFVDKLKQKGVDLEGKLLCNYTVYYMEDLAKQQVKKPTLILNFLRVMLLPAWYLEKRFFKKVSLDDVATIIFSSGSEGTPKGVELTHFNLMGNIKQCASVINVGPEDVFLGLLPMFHAFGFSITTMLCMVEGVPVATCPDPTDVRLIGRMAAEFKVTIMVATGTFLRMWGTSRYIHPLMFEHVRGIYAGAEKIREDVRNLYRSKFKLEIFEGFGCTETTPVASVNTKDFLLDDYKTVVVGNKPGTVGVPMPGCQFRIVDPDTLEELPLGTDGLILIGGAQIMKGYLNDPVRTENAIAMFNGRRWYKTGDKGHIDEDGFLTIVDRYSRFAKLGGEMVSLGAVDFKISENALFEDIDHIAVPVPDGAKGEKIVLLYSGDKSEDEVKTMLRQIGLPPLMVPGAVLKLDELPKLGSGKFDVQTGKKIAREHLGISV